MALNKRSLVRIGTSPLAGTNTQVSLFFLATSDAVATVIADGFFNDARDQLTPGDVVIVSAVIGGTADVLLVRIDTVPASGDVTASAETGASGS
ncbi:MAG: hypothetical protein JJ891_16790 [Rhizobiaceae bacterium]|jgi:hypothetical protein|nr:hypothetical protein [Rhizobiaceae bacterium]